MSKIDKSIRAFDGWEVVATRKIRTGPMGDGFPYFVVGFLKDGNGRARLEFNDGKTQRTIAESHDGCAHEWPASNSCIHMFWGSLQDTVEALEYGRPSDGSRGKVLCQLFMLVTTPQDPEWLDALSSLVAPIDCSGAAAKSLTRVLAPLVAQATRRDP